MTGEVQFALTADDFVAVSRQFYMRKFTKRNTLIKITVTVLALATFIGLIEYLPCGCASFAFWTAVTTVPWLLFAIAFVVGLCFWSTGRRARQIYGESKLSGAVTRYSWSETGWVIENAKSKSNLLWSDLYGWARRRDFILIFLHSAMFYVIPVKFLDEPQVQDLEDSLRSAGVPAR